MQRALHRVRNGGVDHADDFVTQIAVIQHLGTLFINNGTLLVHDVVVGQDVFTAVEVLILELLLRGFDGSG